MLHTVRTLAALSFALLLLPLVLRAADAQSSNTHQFALAAADDPSSDKKSEDSKAENSKKDDAKKDDAKKEEPKKDDTKKDDTKKEDAKNGDKAKADKADSKAADDKSKDAKTAGAKPADAKPAEPPKPPTSTVKKGPFKVELSLDGVFESKRNTEVSISPRSWSDFSVETAVDQGTKVKQGDTLIQFDPERIDDQIKDLEAGRKLAELSLDQSSAEVRLLEQAMPLDLQAAERSSRLAEVDFNQFLSQDRELSQRQAEFLVKRYTNNLEYAKEELKQLERMYKADDLTEETEEIVLKRTRDQVEEVNFYYELVKIMRDRTMKIELPREEESLKDSVNRTALTLQKARTALPIMLDRQRLELERQKYERAKAVERLNKLQHDRGLMKVTAPADGVVYYGNWTRGLWSGGSGVASRMRKGGRISAEEVFMTIVDPNNLFIRSSVPERDLWQLRRGLTGTAMPAADGEQRLPASLDEFTMVPGPDGKYPVTLLVDVARLAKDLPPPVPGMNCKIKLTAYSNDNALTLPAKAIQTDKQNEEQQYVWLPGSDGKPTRKNVKIGRKTAETMEIVDGLAAGDKVLRDAPKEDE